MTVARTVERICYVKIIKLLLIIFSIFSEEKFSKYISFELSKQQLVKLPSQEIQNDFLLDGHTLQSFLQKNLISLTLHPSFV